MRRRTNISSDVSMALGPAAGSMLDFIKGGALRGGSQVREDTTRQVVLGSGGMISGINYERKKRKTFQALIPEVRKQLL